MEGCSSVYFGVRQLGLTLEDAWEAASGDGDGRACGDADEPTGCWRCRRR
jgi:hypothetical protein